MNELAAASDVSPVSVRHHLSNLQAESLVAVEDERHGVGRPRQLFSLTETGLDLFPSRYVRLTNRLLDEIKESIPAGKVEELFSGVASTHGGRRRPAPGRAAAARSASSAWLNSSPKRASRPRSSIRTASS